MELGLEGRTFAVTGAGGGIGAEVAIAFAAEGARVLLVDQNAAAADETLRRMTEPNQHAVFVADLADLSTHADLVATAEHDLGGLDGLAHLAAVLRRRDSIDDVTEDDWDLQVNVNMKATFFLNRAVASALRRSGGGSIVNFTSQGWLTGGFGGSVVYAATKGAVVSMSRGLARALAPDGIRVNTVAPGAVDTDMMRSGLSADDMNAFVETIPLGRMAHPSEMAGLVVFLCSDHGRYITGATVNATGGQIMY